MRYLVTWHWNHLALSWDKYDIPIVNRHDFFLLAQWTGARSCSEPSVPARGGRRAFHLIRRDRREKRGLVSRSRSLLVVPPPEQQEPYRVVEPGKQQRIRFAAAGAETVAVPAAQANRETKVD